MGSRSFVESFMVKVLHEDLGIIFSFFMFINFRAIFTMLLLYYAQCQGYLFCMMFPSLGTLQHYVEFNIRTITMLEKLFGA